MHSLPSTTEAPGATFEFLDLRAQFATIREEVLSAVNSRPRIPIFHPRSGSKTI